MLDQPCSLASYLFQQKPFLKLAKACSNNIFYTPVAQSSRYVWKINDPDEKPLGKGYTSVIYRGLDLKYEDAIAVKIVPKHKQKLLASDKYYRAIYHKLPKHPNILRLRDFLEDSENFYIISDLYQGSDLVDYVLRFSPRCIPNHNIQMVLFQILQGVHHLHKNKILHRDIKLDNILFKDMSLTDIAIVDYDMSLMVDWPELPRPLKAPNEISIVGTKDYMAPEGYNGIYSEASDLWSVGVILYIFLDGHFPYDLSKAKGGGQIIKDILRRGIQIRPQVQSKFPLAVDLVKRLLTYDVNYRLKSAKEALSHPWFLRSINTLCSPVSTPVLSVTASTNFKDEKADKNEKKSVIVYSSRPNYHKSIHPSTDYPYNSRRWTFFPKFHKYPTPSN